MSSSSSSELSVHIRVGLVNPAIIVPRMIVLNAQGPITIPSSSSEDTVDETEKDSESNQMPPPVSNSMHMTLIEGPTHAWCDNCLIKQAKYTLGAQYFCDECAVDKLDLSIFT